MGRVRGCGKLGTDHFNEKLNNLKILQFKVKDLLILTFEHISTLNISSLRIFSSPSEVPSFIISFAIIAT